MVHLTPFSNDLPNGWVCTTLANCAEILDSQRVPINAKERETRISGKSVSELYPYYGATGQVGWIDDYLFDEELVLLGEDGAPFLDFSKDTAYLIKDKSWVNNHAHVLRARTEVTSNQLLCHYLNIFDYHGYLTGTTRLKLNQSTMRKIPVPLPPLAEQKRIVAKLEVLFIQLDAAVDSLKTAQTQLHRYRQSLLKAAFEGKLTRKWREGYSGELEPMSVSEIATLNKLAELPDGWGWTTLANCAEILDSQRVPINAKERKIRISGKLESELYPYYGATGQVGWIDDYLFDEDLVLLGEDGAPFFDFLKDTAYLIKGKSWVNNHAHVLKAKAETASNQFLCHYLNTFDYHGYLTGTTRLKLNQSAMRKIPVPIPPLPEQQGIVAKIERCFSIADKAETTIAVELKRAERLRQSMLKHAFSGKLVPQDPNDEPARGLLERIQVEKKQEPKQEKKTATKSKTQDDDNYPLLALAGALERNNDSLVNGSLVESRGDNSESKRSR